MRAGQSENGLRDARVGSVDRHKWRVSVRPQPTDRNASRAHPLHSAKSMLSQRTHMDGTSGVGNRLRSTYLRVAIDDGIAVVTLANPPANVLTRPMLEDLHAALDVIEDDGVRAVILTGQGGTFSDGVDIQTILACDAHEIIELARMGHRMLNRIEAAQKPVIAAVDGHCLGGGLEIALACHLRLASSRARLALPEISLGLVPGLGGTQRLPNLVGRARAYEMVLTGKPVRALQAAAMGLLNAVVPTERLMPEAHRLARRIAAKRSDAVRGVMECVGHAVNSNGVVGQCLEREIFAVLSTSTAVRQALGLLSRRQPQPSPDRQCADA